MRPERLDIDPHAPDVGRVFRYWLRTFELFLKALRDERQAEVGRTSSDSSSSEPKKLRLLLTFLSPTIFEYVEDAQSYDEVIKILEKTYRKQKNPVFGRHLLATRGQRPDESLAELLQALNVLAKDCVFKDVTAAQSKQEFIRDTFINGLSSSSIRQRLLEHADLDLRKAIDLADSLDMAQKQSAMYSSKLLYSASATTDRREIDDLNHQVSKNERSAVAAPTFKKDSQRNNKRLCFFCGGPWDHILKTVLPETTFAHHAGLKVTFLPSVAKAKLSVDQS